MTPLDIENHRFGHRLRGYAADEVDGFLQLVAEDAESLLRENENLRDELRRAQERVEALAVNEKVLRDTLLNAQSMSEHTRQTAVRESELLIGAAEVQAEKILDAAHRRAAQLAEDIRNMRGLRVRLATELRSSMETHLALIDGFERETGRDEEIDRVVRSLAPARKRSPRVLGAGPGGGP